MSTAASAPRRLGIVGASARAAAASAVRGGFEVVAFDLFADADLAEIAQVVKVEGPDQHLIDAFRAAAVDAWLYTGGVENYRELVEELSAIRPLLGCGTQVLSRVRDPRWLNSVLRADGFPYAEVLHEPPAEDADSPWLFKRMRSGGGIGIRRYVPGESFDSREHYLQRFIDGTPVSGMYLAGGGRSDLVAAFQQLIGQRWTGVPGEFMYCGAVGPLPLSEPLTEQLRRVGAYLAKAAGMTGLFGIDAIASGDRLTVLEVNPRYTASMELWERASGLSAVALHERACRGLPMEAIETNTGGVHAKAIVFATEPVMIGPAFVEYAARCNAAQWPAIADVPAAGQRIAGNHPICTLFAAGSSGAAAVERLQFFAAELAECLKER